MLKLILQTYIQNVESLYAFWQTTRRMIKELQATDLQLKNYCVGKNANISRSFATFPSLAIFCWVSLFFFIFWSEFAYCFQVFSIWQPWATARQSERLTS